MEYRFTLELANTVANLTFGKVMSCCRDIFNSKENYEGFMSFLDKFDKFSQNVYSNKKEQDIKDIKHVRDTLSEAYNKFEGLSPQPIDFENNELNEPFLYSNYGDVLKALSELSRRLELCSVKSLLLPQLKNSDDCNSDFMTSEKNLKNLLSSQEGDSCLILQPQEAPKSIVIFDAFPNFEVALRQADLWPAVLFWDSKNFAFVPVEHYKELLSLYETVKDKGCGYIGELKRIAQKKKKANNYIFHLSDLHFGAGNVDSTGQRLKSLVKSQFKTIDDNDNVEFVITGDAIHSPNRTNENYYRNFSDNLETYRSKPPIRILGNHDIHRCGLAFLRNRHIVANIAGNYPKIKHLHEHKVALLLFNSNTNGDLARGEIGTAQMSRMGNLLDKDKDLKDYLLIAVMHHHLWKPPSDYYNEKWYKIWLNSLLDETMKLTDAEDFTEWLQQRNVKFVLHGHKHRPFRVEDKGINVICCGSSTGKSNHRENVKTYTSYNLLKISEMTVTITQFAEEVYDDKVKHIKSEIVFLRSAKP
jgi:predicted phosphodiesterase